MRTSIDLQHDHVWVVGSTRLAEELQASTNLGAILESICKHHDGGDFVVSDEVA